jgi:hypothetical protein
MAESESTEKPAARDATSADAGGADERSSDGAAKATEREVPKASDAGEERDKAPAKTPTGEPLPWKVALAIFALALVVYGIFAAERLTTHSPDNHFSYLADSYLHGTLSVRCQPEALRARTCPPGAGGNDWAFYNDKWFVAFPSFPAVVYMPAVALFGRDFANRRLDIALGALAPALLYLLLARLSREKKSERTWKENVLFSLLFAFGTVFFFSSIQGSVWFVAHVINASLVIGYLWYALDARSPIAAGVLLGLAIHTRANMAFAAPFFAIEALRVHRSNGKPAQSLIELGTGADKSKAIRACVEFAIPVAIAVFISRYLNFLRFDDWNETGYRYLQIGWRGRIERWGLFNYHYLGRNLGIFLASTPWFTRDFPYVVVSLHGLAVWVTTPHFLELVRLRVRGTHGYTLFLAASAGAVLTVLLFYQNSGWVQFGFRFSNDVAAFAIVLLALNGVRINRLWLAAFAIAVAVNTFGAWTFERQIVLRGQRVTFYDNDYTQNRYFQPD